MSDTFRRTRGPATRKFRRSAAKGPEHARREQFGRSWGSYNSEQAKKLRAGAR